MKSTLSPKDLASAVGVSESSLKRWADDGRLRVSRTAGGHRRIPIQEAIRFAREARLPISRPDILGLPALDSTAASTTRNDPAQAFHDKLAAGDTLSAQALLIDLYLSGQSMAAICDGPIHSAMTVIGEIWNHAEDGIFIEHRATDICLQALSVLRSLINTPTLDGAVEPEQDHAPIALGCAPANDPYMIPSLMCATVLADAGYRTMNLGADTPFDVLDHAIAAHKPKLVWLSCASDTAAPSAEQIIALGERLKQQHIALAVGGRVLEDTPFPSSQLTQCKTMGELEQFGKGLLSR